MLFDAKRARPLRPLPPPRPRNGALSDLHATARHRSHMTRASALPYMSRPGNYLSHPLLNVTYIPDRDLGTASEQLSLPQDALQPLSPELSYLGGDHRIIPTVPEESGPSVARRSVSPSFLSSQPQLEAVDAADTTPRSPSRMWLEEYHQNASRQPRSYTAIIDDIMSGSFGASEPISRQNNRRVRNDTGEGDIEGRRARRRLRDAQIESDRGQRTHPWRDSRRDGIVFDEAANDLPLSSETDDATPPARWFVDATWDYDSPYPPHPSGDDHEYSLDEEEYMTYVPGNDEAGFPTII